MKEIKEKTKKIDNEYFININFLIKYIEDSYKEKRLIFLEGYIERTLLRIEKNEPVSLLYEEDRKAFISYGSAHRKVFISYGSAILGVEELLSIFPNDGVKNLCEYFYKKFNEAPDFMLKKIKPICFFHTTESGEEMVNLRGIAQDLGILEDEIFQEAIEEAMEEYDPLRFDGVRGSFIPKESALSVLNIFHHYSGKKNTKLQEIITNKKL
jgi:hypothetical protein